MGPRFCKRGNWHAQAKEAAEADASMGPRFCKRGNLIIAGAIYTGIQLQWGHAFVSVETSTHGGTPHVSARCFNGATLL